mmetsp:Transcript_561/g.1953  ORF Transcript_561/g.1953 Transcript_561/m.1953 type:complete len:885 (-) Transcript_561:26-2680(-)
MASSYAKLGLCISRHPLLFLAVGFGSYFAMLPGTLIMKGEEWLMWMKLDSQFVNVFAFQDTQYMEDYNHGTGLFDSPREEAVTMIPKGGSIMNAGFLASALAAEAELKSKRGEYDGNYYGLEDVCSRAVAGGPCEWQSLLDLLVPSRDPAALSGLAGQTPAEVGASLVANVPVQMRSMLRLMVSTGGSAWPGAAATDAQLGTWLATRTAIMTFVKLRSVGDLAMHTRAYELEIEAFVQRNRHGYQEIGEVSCLLELSFGREIAVMCINALALIFSTVGIMVVYGVWWLGTQTRKPGNSQRLLIAAGAMIPAMASFASFGVLGYIRLPFNVLAFMVPFLGIAMGIDNIFVCTSALKHVGPEKSIEVAISEAVSEAGVAVTTTSLTSLVALLVSIFTSLNLPGFVAFNTATAITVFGNWLGALVLYPAMLTLNERRIEGGYRDILFWKKRAPICQSEAPVEGAGVSCLQGLADPGPPLKRFIVQRYAPLIENNLVFKVLGSIFFLSCTVAGFALMQEVDSGMPDRYMVPDNSYLQDFFEQNEEHFGNAPPMDVQLAVESLDLGSAAYRAKLTAVMNAARQDPDVAMVDCWPDVVASSLPSDASRAQAVDAVANLVRGQGAMYRRDMRSWAGGDVGTGLPTVAKCHVFYFLSWDAKAKAAQADRLIRLLRGTSAPFHSLDVTPYHKLFAIQVGRYHNIKGAMLFTAAMAVAAVYVTLNVFLPPHIAVIAIVSMLGTLGALFGYMAIAGSNFNMVTYCSVVMAIGFCVDYATHVAHFSDHHMKPGTPWSARMCKSIQTCGYDVGHGAFTAFLGVCLMMAGGSPAFRVFCLNVVVITVFGGLSALFGVPSLVSLLSSLMQHGPCSSARVTPVVPADPSGSAETLEECKC